MFVEQGNDPMIYSRINRIQLISACRRYIHEDDEKVLLAEAEAKQRFVDDYLGDMLAKVFDRGRSAKEAVDLWETGDKSLRDRSKAQKAQWFALQVAVAFSDGGRPNYNLEPARDRAEYYRGSPYRADVNALSVDLQHAYGRYVTLSRKYQSLFNLHLMIYYTHD